MKLLKKVFNVVVGCLLIDAGGFLMWVASGQAEPDGFYYIGKITATIIRLIKGLI